MKMNRLNVLVKLAGLIAVGCGSSQAPADAPSQSVDAGKPADSKASEPSEGPIAINAGQCPQTALLDDLDDGNNQIAVAEGRGGYWYTYADETGSTIAPEPGTNFVAAAGGANDTPHAAQMHGKMGTAKNNWAGMGFSLVEPKKPYGLSCCQGVSFRAKKNGEGTGSVRFKVGDVQTVPEGGICGNACYNDFGADVTLTDEWQEFSFAFADMKQEPYWGMPRPAIDPARIYQIQWQVKEPGADFDIWVDDVQLVGCSQ